MEQNWHHPAVAPFPAWHKEINVLWNKAAYFWPLPLADGLIRVHKMFFLLLITFIDCIHRNCIYEGQLLWASACTNAMIWSFYLFMLGAESVTMLWCQVLSGWKLHNRHSKSKAALWERKGVIRWHKEQDSCVCQGCERFGVSGGFLL